MPTITLHSLPRVSFILGVLEAVLLITILSLFAYGYPDATRTTLWEEGGRRHWNSDPALRIYYYANHKDPPPIPYIWSRSSSDFNLCVAVLSLWVFVARSLLRIFTVLTDWTDLYLHTCVLAFWVLSLAWQQSGDFSDMRHVARSPWYLSIACSNASPGAQKACRIAQGWFGMTIAMVIFHTACILKIIAFKFFQFWHEKVEKQSLKPRNIRLAIPMGPLSRQYPTIIIQRPTSPDHPPRRSSSVKHPASPRHPLSPLHLIYPEESEDEDDPLMRSWNYA